MKVLITGASGFLGINLIRHLLSMSITDIVAFDIDAFDHPEKDRVIFVQGDIRDEKAVGDAMKGVSVVIHAAAALPLYKKEDILSTGVKGTQNLLEASFANNVERFIFISSVSVYGNSGKSPLGEGSDLQGESYYARAKISAEEICKQYRKKGMCVSIIRPRPFIGPERMGAFAILFEWAKDAKNFPIIGNGNNKYQLLDVSDLCEAIFLCMTLNKSVVSDTFNIGASSFSTIKEDFQSVLDEAGFNKRVIPFPAGPIIAILKILDFMRISPFHKWIYETASSDSVVSIEKASDRLGFMPRYSNKDALLRNYKWYLEEVKNSSAKTGATSRSKWKEGIPHIIKRFF